MHKFSLWTVLHLCAIGIFVVETAHIRDNGTHLQVNRIKKETVTDDPCLRTVVRKQPRWRKGLRKSDIQCEMTIYDMYYRDQEEKNKLECINSRGDDTVHMGRDAEITEFPHMAALGYKDRNNDTWVFNCGGSLISSKYVLTAAHCVVSYGRGNPADHIDALPTIVRLGQINITERTLGLRQVDVKILNMWTHPNYEHPKKYYDIALLELEKEVEFNKEIQPACLWNHPNYMLLGNKAIVTGWGELEANGNKRSPILQAATVDILNSNHCDELLTGLVSRRWFGVHEDQICAGTLTGGADTCHGDSGGPLQVKIPVSLTTQGTISYVLGVTSFGTGCGFRDNPGLYANVYTALDWIESVVWPV